MAVYEVPLSPTPQTFQISLAGTTYTLTVKWNAQNASWMLDIADINSNAIVSGIPIITGADLLAQYEYLNIGGGLQAQTDNDTDAVPTLDNLGINGHLYFITSIAA